ncbi:hypothetical protein [Bosea sp. BH3]|uniref:hypothetical protein n=1 Tax=Bosea sp. BH3 TaxID=2871701 RepID=UPI0021CB2910|nr:hypothetical protein [Bosea sp. BH3]MCU4179889.1 hypothetical protein [Bosea sp. BH3]
MKVCFLGLTQWPHMAQDCFPRWGCGTVPQARPRPSHLVHWDRLKGAKLPVSGFHDLRFEPHPNFPGAAEVFARMQTAPKFVFSRDVIEWIEEHSGDYTHAVGIAIGAGRTELTRRCWSNGRKGRINACSG